MKQYTYEDLISVARLAAAYSTDISVPDRDMKIGWAASIAVADFVGIVLEILVNEGPKDETQGS